MGELGNVAGYKVKVQKLTLFLCMSNKLKTQTTFNTGTKLKCLGINLIEDVHVLYGENYGEINYVHK